MKITPEDVGRKVVLRNGIFDYIIKYDNSDAPIETQLSWHKTNGKSINESTLDIIAFADELQTEVPPLAVQRPTDILNASNQPTKTLRDEFAMAALTGLCSGNNWFECKDAPKFAYVIADAMLKAREAK
jgi:hypothetical protein